MDRTARLRRTAAALVLVVLAACSGQGADDRSTGDAADQGADGARPDAATDGEVDADAFPVTIEHMLGTATIEAPPERVVALGPADADIALALGVTPVAMVGNPYSDDERFPWVGGEHDLDGVRMLPFETTAAVAEGLVDLRPDLVLATTATADPDLYDRFGSFDVPIVAPLTGPVQDTWQDLTRAVGQALGRSERAEEVIAGVEDLIAATRDDLPGLQGRTVVVASAQSGGVVRVVNRSTDISARLFAELGMEVPAALEELGNDTPVGATDVSAERVDLLDGDALFLSSVGEARDQLEANPLFADLRSVRSGAYLPYGNDDAFGLRVPSPLSIPYVLDLARPTLEIAAGAG